MYTLRESYWILKGRKTIKEVIKTCIIYKRFNAKPISESEGLLPQDRTESFLLGLRRFIARRVRPCVIYSDNGTNFKGAYRLYQKVNLEKLKNVEELNPISWNLIPPQVPWWGGFWERVIGLVKRTLRKTLGKTSLNHEEVFTLLCDYESLINSRPLTYVTDDVEDL
ncbi:integrase catalytic domain-containing protein [Trichonephila clavipes]|nr:integrase catalytic domain-containing protein [Trichonephila clavipes]